MPLQPNSPLRRKTTLTGTGELNSPTKKVKKILLLVHGIRTHASWQTLVTALLTKESDTIVIPIKFGYFDLFRFWMPFDVFRRGPIDRLRIQIESALDQYKGHELFILAHSYGTYATVNVLLQNPKLQISGMVLCGSIIPKDFDWWRIHNQIKAPIKRDAIINECGNRDIWPVLAQSTTWGYGASGTDGFGSVSVRDRYHPIGHSSYFTVDFVKKYWLPIIRGEKVDFSETDRAGEPSPRWFLLLRLPYKWLVVLAPFLLALTLVINPPSATEVVLMDSNAIKYHPDTPGSNARFIREMIDELPLQARTSYEAVYKGFDSDKQIIARHPQLIIIHLSAFYDQSKEEDDLDLRELERSDKEFRSFISLMYKSTNAKFLVYTRGLADIDAYSPEQQLALRRGYDAQKTFLRTPPIQSRAVLFEISSPDLFKDGATKREFKELMQSLLSS
jgi:pimeloyl-ACP methyl ester carboxylesterase